MISILPGFLAGLIHVFSGPDHLAAIAPRSRAPQHGLSRLTFNEIHLGTFSREGTADGAAPHLRELADAG